MITRNKRARAGGFRHMARGHVALVLALCLGGARPELARRAEWPGDKRPAPREPRAAEVAPALDPDLAPARGSWAREHGADRRCLSEALGERQRTFVLGARVVPGVSGPAIEYYSYGDTGLVASFDHYWPASTLKLVAAVGALETLAERGFGRDAEVAIEDADGPFRGTVEELVWLALTVSDNPAYNRLARIAGFDALEGRLDWWGLDRTTIQRAYTDGERAFTLRAPRSLAIEEGSRSLSIAGARGSVEDPACPAESNCTSLADLLEALRKVALHDELPPLDRFALGPVERDTLVAAMRASKSRIRPAAERVFGSATVFGKTGSVPDNDRLDHVFVDAGPERYLVAISVPYEEPDETVDRLAEEVLRALRDRCRGAPPIEHDAGLLEVIAGDVIAASGDVRYWVDAFAWDGPPPAEPDRLYTIVAFDHGRPVARRSLRVR
jgi:hypothetical protein